MTIDVGLRIACNEAVYQRARTVAPWLAVVAVFVAAALLRQVVPLNTDVSWLLVIGERVLDGQRLYVDIVEINPPMAVFAYVPGIALARALGLDPANVTNGLILALAAASLLATWRILRLSSMLDDVRWAYLAIWATAVVTVMPMGVFGQREHIATLTFLPALAVWALRSNREPLPLWSVLIAGIGAGITLAFKPFFALPAILCIVLSMIRSRSWRVAFSPENVIAGGLATIYALCSYLFYPEYFTVIYPLVRDTYLSWSMPVSVVVLNSATMIWATAMVLMLLLRKRRLDSAVLVTILASLGFAFAFFLQRRGWPYHSYPMVALAMLAMGYVLMAVADAKSSRRRLGIVAICPRRSSPEACGSA